MRNVAARADGARGTPDFPATVRMRGDRIVGATEDLPEWLAELVATAEMDAKYDHLDLGEWR